MDLDDFLTDKEETVMKSLAMPKSLKEKVADLAKAKGVSETKVINAILKAYFSDKGK